MKGETFPLHSFVLIKSTEIYGKIRKHHNISVSITGFRHKIRLRTPVKFVTFIYFMATGKIN